MSDDFISRSELIKKIFPYGMPDDGNYPINAKAVREAIEKAPAIEMILDNIPLVSAVSCDKGPAAIDYKKKASFIFVKK